MGMEGLYGATASPEKENSLLVGGYSAFARSYEKKKKKFSHFSFTSCRPNAPLLGHIMRIRGIFLTAVLRDHFLAVN